MVRSLAALTFMFALLSGCGPAKEPVTPEGGEGSGAATSEGEGAEKPANEGAAEAKPEGEGAAEAKPEAKPAAPSKATSPAEDLARDIVKGGGRRIGWSATKKTFAVPYEKRNETSFSIEVHFYGEDGQSHDPMQICQMGECAEKLDEKFAELLPKLAQRLEEGEFTPLRSIGWPDNRDELEVSTLGMKLKWSGGKIQGLKEGKKPVTFSVAGGRLDISELKAIFLVPDTNLLGVLGTPAKLPGVVQTFHVVKMP